MGTFFFNILRVKFSHTSAQISTALDRAESEVSRIWTAEPWHEFGHRKPLFFLLFARGRCLEFVAEMPQQIHICSGFDKQRKTAALGATLSRNLSPSDGDRLSNITERLIHPSPGRADVWYWVQRLTLRPLVT